VIARDVDSHVHRNRAVPEAVVVEEPLGAVRAVRDRGDGFALELLRLAVDLLARSGIRLVAEAVEDCLKTCLPRSASCDLRIHVADERVAEAAVSPKQVGDVDAWAAA